MSARPRATIIIASVAMKGGRPRIETLRPLMRPIAMPTSRVRSRPRPRGRFILSPARKMPAMTATRLIPVPTDRSMPEVAMTKVAPSAMTPVKADCRTMSRYTFMVAKVKFGTATLKNARTTNNATVTSSSCMFLFRKAATGDGASRPLLSTTVLTRLLRSLLPGRRWPVP